MKKVGKKKVNNNRRRSLFRLGLAAVIFPFVLPAPASANERHFTFTYESGVLPPQGKEIELWVTPRIGREDFYSRFDLRVEYEIGLTDRLQTALYLNSKALAKETDGGEKETEFEFAGVSSEWKYKLFDPVADPLGFALYGEVTGSPDELELEAKLIVDKRIGNVLLVANLVLENEWEFEPDETEREFKLVETLGLTYFFTSRFSAGLELVNHNEWPDGGGLEHSALFLGPTFSYAEKGWWVALSVLPQLPALKGGGHGDERILDEHEKVMARLLFAFHL